MLPFKIVSTLLSLDIYTVPVSEYGSCYAVLLAWSEELSPLQNVGPERGLKWVTGGSGCYYSSFLFDWWL